MNSKQRIRGLGWRPDVPDFRDYQWQSSLKITRLPKSKDLTKKIKWLSPFDQGELGSCTANAISMAMSYYVAQKNKKKKFSSSRFSRLFIYYNERVVEGTVNSDSGAQIRTGIKSVVKQGDCSERSWPYRIDRFKDKPSGKCYDLALKNRIPKYQRVEQDATSIRMALAQGHPIVCGIAIYSSFMSETVAKTGVVSIPSPREKLLGGHAVLIVGYDTRANTVKVLNSWGSRWGKKGYFTLPFGYVTNSDLADDLWIFT